MRFLQAVFLGRNSWKN